MDNERHERARRWPALGYVFLAGIALLTAWGLAMMVWAMHEVVFLAFFALLMATVLRYPVNLLQRWTRNRAVAVALTLLLLLAALAGGVAITLPVLARQWHNLIEQIPVAIERLQDLWHSVLSRLGVSPGAIESSVRERIASELSTLLTHTLPVALQTLTVAAGLIVLLVLALYLTYDPDLYRDGMLRLVPPPYEPAARELFTRMEATLRRWLFGTLASMSIVGVATGVGLMLVGIDGWLVLAIVMFFGEFVPYIGPIVAGAPGVAIGLAQSPADGLWAALVYFGVQQLEGHLISPLVMKRAVDVAPVVLIVAQLTMGAAFGFLGILIATPLTAVAQVAVEYLYIERYLGRPPAQPAAVEREKRKE